MKLLLMKAFNWSMFVHRKSLEKVQLKMPSISISFNKKHSIQPLVNWTKNNLYISIAVPETEANRQQYTSHFEHHNFSTDDWIKMIQHNPEIMKQPIALRGDIAILIETPTDIIKI